MDCSRNAMLEECRAIFLSVESCSRKDEEGRARARAAHARDGTIERVAAFLSRKEASYDEKCAALACLSELAFAVSDLSVLERFRACGADVVALRALVTGDTIELKTWAVFALCNMNANSPTGLPRSWSIGVPEAAVVTVAVLVAAAAALKEAGIAERAPIVDFTATPAYELPLVPIFSLPLFRPDGSSDETHHGCASAAVYAAEEGGCFASTPESVLMGRYCSLVSVFTVWGWGIHTRAL
jgi:hypothetical protein